MQRINVHLVEHSVVIPWFINSAEFCMQIRGIQRFTCKSHIKGVYENNTYLTIEFNLQHVKQPQLQIHNAHTHTHKEIIKLKEWNILWTDKRHTDYKGKFSQKRWV